MIILPPTLVTAGHVRQEVRETPGVRLSLPTSYCVCLMTLGIFFCFNYLKVKGNNNLNLTPNLQGVVTWNQLGKLTKEQTFKLTVSVRCGGEVLKNEKIILSENFIKAK